MALKASLVITGDAKIAVDELRRLEKALEDAAARAERASRANRKLSDAVNDNARDATKQAYAIRNVGQQVGDFGLQVASGSGVARAFSNQIGQLGYAMSELGGRAGAVGKFLVGPWGIALTIALAVAAPFVEKLLEGGEAADSLAKQLDDAAAAADSFGNAQSLLGKVIDLTTGRLKTQNVTLLENIKLVAQAKIIAASETQSKATASLKNIAKPDLLAPSLQGTAGLLNLLGGNTYGAFNAGNPLKGYSDQEKALRPLKGVIDDYAASINRVDLSRLTDLKRGDIEKLSAQVGGLTSDAIAKIDRLAKAGRLAGRDLIATKKAIIDLSIPVQDQLANQALLDAIGGKAISPLLKPFERPDKPKRAPKGPSAASLAASRLGINDRIADIEAQYDPLPESIKKANDQLRELGKIKADIDKQPLLPGADGLRKRIEALGQVIRNDINRPFNDYIDQQAKAAKINDLLIRGHQDEAAALQQVVALQEKGPKLQAEQITGILKNIQARREETLLIRDQQALIESNINAVRSFRGALEQTIANALRGRFSLDSILSSIGNSFIQIASQRIVEQFFGDTLRSIESRATGADDLEASTKRVTAALEEIGGPNGSFATALDQAAGAATGFATALNDAAARINGTQPAAANDNGGTPTAANDNGPSAAPAYDDIPETVVRGKRLAGGSASDVLVDLTTGFLNDLGIGIPRVVGTGIKDVLGRIEKSLPEALKGAFIGSSASRIVLGDRGTGGAIGSSIGGVIGQEVGKKVLTGVLGSFAGPIGSIAGGLLGGLFGGLFKPKERPGGVTIGAVNGTADQTGTSGTDKKKIAQSKSLGDAVSAGINQIVDRLGGALGDFSVSIGLYKKDLRVNTGGKPLGGVKNSGAVSFGEDQEAAISYAISLAIQQGAVQGLSAAVQKALKSSTDIDKALTEALKVSDLETALGGLGAQLQNEFKSFEKIAADRLRIAKTYGFDIVQVEALNAKERLKLSERLLKEQVGSLQDLIDSITGGALFEGSAVDQRKALLEQIAAVQADANAGVEGAADKLANLLQQLNAVSKDVFGTTGGFSADQQSILDTAREVIASANQRINKAQGGSDPALKETNAQLDESNDQLARIAADMADSVSLLKVIANNNEIDGTAKLRFAAGY